MHEDPQETIPGTAVAEPREATDAAPRVVGSRASAQAAGRGRTSGPTRTSSGRPRVTGSATAASETVHAPSRVPATGQTVGPDPSPVRSAPVDERTAARQRITLFGWRRRGGDGAAPASESGATGEAASGDPTTDAGDGLLAALVSEDLPATETARETVQDVGVVMAGAAEPVAPTASDWVVDQIYAAEERDEELASIAIAPTGAAAHETEVPRAAPTTRARTMEGAAQRSRRVATTRHYAPARPAPSVDAPVVLYVADLHKRYGDVVAVDGVSLNVRAGSIYGFVGPNGAGKTTTLSIVTGLLRADAGTVYLNGIDAIKHHHDAQRAIGVLPDHLRTFDRLTGAQLLFYAGVLRGLDAATTRRRSADLATAFGIDDAMGRLVADYSSGMTKKVCLAAAMIHSPRLLVLDEPFEGVDPVSAATITGILERYATAGGTVLFSSHSMDLVQRTCDSVAIIVGGVVLDSGPVDEVRGEKSLEDHFVELAGGRKAAEGLEWLHGFSD